MVLGLTGRSPGGQKRWSCSDHQNRYVRLPLRTSRLNIKELDRWSNKLINNMTAATTFTKIKNNFNYAIDTLAYYVKGTLK